MQASVAGSKNFCAACPAAHHICSFMPRSLDAAAAALGHRLRSCRSKLFSFRLLHLQQPSNSLFTQKATF